MTRKRILVASLIPLLFISIIGQATGEKESVTDFGRLEIDNDSFFIAQDEFVILNISGEIKNPIGLRLNILVDKPDGSILEAKTFPNKDGEFYTSLLLDAYWEKGEYTLTAIYDEQEIGKVSFEVTSQAPKSSSQTNLVTMELEREEYTISKDKTVYVEINGQVSNYIESSVITFKVLKPDGSIQEFPITAERTGEYDMRITVHDDWEAGKYDITATYLEEEFGPITFSLFKAFVANQEVVTESQPLQNNTTIETKPIPGWIKNNAKWWSEGQIDDGTFVSGIQFLMTEKIIDIPDLPESESKKPRPSFVDPEKDPQSYVDRYNNEANYKEWFDKNYPDYTIEEAVGIQESIPDWIKNNAEWWSQGLITEDDFVKGIEFLVKNGIIRV